MAGESNHQLSKAIQYFFPALWNAQRHPITLDWLLFDHRNQQKC